MIEYTEVSLRLEPSLPEKLLAQIEEFTARVEFESRMGHAAVWVGRAN